MNLIELLNTFPEEKDIIPVKIKERKSEIRKSERWARKQLQQVQLAGEFDRFFWAKALEVLTPDEPYKQLKRLEILGRLAPAKGAKSAVKERKAYIDRLQQIERAKLIPIQELYPFKKIKRGYHQWKACCPLHNEKTPSFVIYLNTNRWYCFGACGVGGDAIDFVIKLKECSFNEALEILNG